MKTIKRTIPTNHHRRFRTATTLGATILALATTAALAAPPEGKGGGKGGGGGDDGDDGGSPSEITAPIAEDSPASYVATKFVWEIEEETRDPEFVGIWVSAVNSSGVAVGHVKRAPSARPDLEPDTFGNGERRAVINVEIEEGVYRVDHVMRDLNALFALALADVNNTRTDGPWRIAYCRELNEAGQIVCRLIPDDQIRAYSTTEAATYGVEAVPSLFAVANLYDLTLTVLDDGVDYDETHPNRDCKGLNENGDVYFQSSIPEVGNTEDLFINDAGSYQLANTLLPFPFDFQLTFNSFPDFCYSVRNPAKGQNETVTLTRRVGDVDEALWSYTSKSYARFSPLGISEGGESVYTTTVFPGDREIPYHVTSTTERIRIADAHCSGAIKWNGRPSLSQAAMKGEEELVILDYETNSDAAEYYVYKPNFGARHRIVFSDPLTGEVDVPLTDSVKGGFTGQVVISAPVDGTGTTDPYVEGVPYSGNYCGGYVVFTTSLNDQYLESYLLKPSQAQ